MNQVFMERFLGCGLNREKLLAFMADIDAEKRALKSCLSQLSSEYGSTLKRQERIRKIKDKNSFLTEEREMVRMKLGALKMDQKALNSAVNNRSPQFCHAFLAAAKRVLSEEQFLDLEARASVMITQNTVREKGDKNETG